jgi:hypothetical protein
MPHTSSAKTESYLASGNPTYDLVSNEPNEEEAELMRRYQSARC